MKSFFRHTLFSIVFLAGLAALLLLLSVIMLPKDNTKEAGIDEKSLMGLFAEPANTIDVVYMGDSTTYSGIIPLEIWRDTGIPSYVAGSPLQYLHYTNDILERMYKTQSPKYLFMDTGSLFYQQSALWLSMYYPKKYMKVFRYHDNWKVLTPENMFAPVNYKHIERDKGHLISYDIMAVLPQNLARYGAPTDSARQFPFGNQACFEKILEQCGKHGTEVILLSVPSIWTWNTQKHNGAQAIAEHYGLRYLDLNLHMDELQIDWDHDTYDAGEHLNDYGAIKVSRYLGKYMRENLDLTDRRDDPRYANWNQALHEYDAELRTRLADNS